MSKAHSPRLGRQLPALVRSLAHLVSDTRLALETTDASILSRSVTLRDEMEIELMLTVKLPGWEERMEEEVANDVF